MANGVLAKYFGQRNFTVLEAERIDPDINFYASDSDPNARSNNDPEWQNNTFSVKWEGYFRATVAGTYYFGFNVDSTFRCYFDDVIAKEYWVREDPHDSVHTWSRVLTADQVIKVNIEYVNGYDRSLAIFYHTPPGGGGNQIVPLTTTPPTILSISNFSPSTAGVGNTVTINGNNFSTPENVSQVMFGANASGVGGVAATSFTVVSNTQITAVVPDNITTGRIKIFRGIESVVSATDLTFTPPPLSISSFTPATGAVGSTVTITGVGFNTPEAVSQVLFGTNSSGSGGVPATSFTVVSNTQITAVLPDGSNAGRIKVVRNTYSALSASNFTPPLPPPPPPTLTSFTPLNAACGTNISLVGTNFTQITDVEFSNANGDWIDAASFQRNSSTSISAIVPNVPLNGFIRVVTAGGTATSTQSFTNIPTITSLTNSSGVALNSATHYATNTPIRVYGANLGAISQIRFGTNSSGVGGTPSPITSYGAGYVNVSVPNGAKSGYIAITTPARVAVSPTVFRVARPAGIQAWWRFSEATGAVAADSGDNAYHAALVGTENIEYSHGVTIPQGKGNWLQFRPASATTPTATIGDAGDEYVLDVSGANLTIEGFVRLPASHSSAVVILQRALSSDIQYSLRITSARVVELVLNNTVIAGPTLADDQKWHYVVAVFNQNDAAGRVRFYVDGVLSQTANYNSPIVDVPGSVVSWSGIVDVDEVRIWNTQVSALTIANNYASLSDPIHFPEWIGDDEELVVIPTIHEIGTGGGGVAETFVVVENFEYSIEVVTCHGEGEEEEEVVSPSVSAPVAPIATKSGCVPPQITVALGTWNVAWTRFQLERQVALAGENFGAWESVNIWTAAPAGVFQFVDNDVLSLGTYVYRARGCNATGCSVWSVPSTALQIKSTTVVTWIAPSENVTLSNRQTLRFSVSDAVAGAFDPCDEEDAPPCYDELSNGAPFEYSMSVDNLTLTGELKRISGTRWNGVYEVRVDTRLFANGARVLKLKLRGSDCCEALATRNVTLLNTLSRGVLYQHVVNARHAPKGQGYDKAIMTLQNETLHPHPERRYWVKAALSTSALNWSALTRENKAIEFEKLAPVVMQRINQSETPTREQRRGVAIFPTVDTATLEWVQQWTPCESLAAHETGLETIARISNTNDVNLGHLIFARNANGTGAKAFFFDGETLALKYDLSQTPYLAGDARHIEYSKNAIYVVRGQGNASEIFAIDMDTGQETMNLKPRAETRQVFDVRRVGTEASETLIWLFVDVSSTVGYSYEAGKSFLKWTLGKVVTLAAGTATALLLACDTALYSSGGGTATPALEHTFASRITSMSDGFVGLANGEIWRKSGAMWVLDVAIDMSAIPSAKRGIHAIGSWGERVVDVLPTDNDESATAAGSRVVAGYATNQLLEKLSGGWSDARVLNPLAIDENRIDRVTALAAYSKQTGEGAGTAGQPGYIAPTVSHKLLVGTGDEGLLLALEVSNLSEEEGAFLASRVSHLSIKAFHASLPTS